MDNRGIWIGLSIFGLLLLACFVQIVYQRQIHDDSNIKRYGAAELNTETMLLSIVDNQGSIVLKAELDTERSVGKTSFDACSINFDSCLTVTNPKESGVECVHLYWKSMNCGRQMFKDCFHLGDSHWYGGYEDHNQTWTIEHAVRDEAAYIAGDSYQGAIGGVLERYFINTNGIGILVNDEVPLYFSLNQGGDNRLCLSSKFDKTPYMNQDSRLPWLKYTICRASNVRTVHEYMYSKYFLKPSAIPDERMFRSPVWSTWAQYHKDINQSIVLEFAKDILKYNFSHSQVEIDDEWAPSYGEMEFDENKFPDARGMISKLHELGFRVTLWIHPFFNTESPSFDEAQKKGYLIKKFNVDETALVSWWDGKAAGVLDVTNDEAFEWFVNKTRYMKSAYGINSFKFDAGEVSYLPEIYRLFSPEQNPNTFSRKWAKLALEVDPDVRHQEVRIGTQTQNLPLFVRMLDKDSLWSSNNGLKTLIPSALHFGLIGYPFILPDMIGGNAYSGTEFDLSETVNSTSEVIDFKTKEDPKPDSELFIRWLQATVFLPSLQFSIVPWQYDKFVIDVSKKMVALHEQFTPRIIELAHEFTRTGAPIVRPLWWIAPTDPTAQIIDDEFLLGDDILVAPVLEKGARTRDIYLPSGIWEDKQRNGEIQGGKWLRNYRVDLEELPYFILVTG